MAPHPPITLDLIRRLPKVVLHDHLDGGLRPATIVELARDQKVDLPTVDPAELASWFERGAARGSLEQYLEGFGLTCAVMQTEDALERVAFEFLQDLHEDGVIYAEIRFAPHLHETQGLNLEAIMDAVLTGLARAESAFGVRWGLIVCALRNQPPELSLKLAELAVSSRERGCLGFDLAGDEHGHPPKDHLDAFHLCQRENFCITIHAGEAFGVPSIWQALQYCGAHRIGHCTRLTEDMVIRDGEVLSIGHLAQYVLDRRIPLEICLSSNVHTGAVPTLAEHPFRHYLRNQFRVTLNTDNRLMSATTLSRELLLAVEHFGADFDDLETLTLNGMKSAFLRHDLRCALIYDSIKPGFTALRHELGLPPRAYPRP